MRWAIVVWKMLASRGRTAEVPSSEPFSLLAVLAAGESTKPGNVSSRARLNEDDPYSCDSCALPSALVLLQPDGSCSLKLCSMHFHV